MGRTIGAAIGAVIVMLFFATVASSAYRRTAASSPVPASAQNRPAAEVPNAVPAQRAH